MVRRAVQRADERFVCANALTEKAQAVFALSEPPTCLGSPILIPDHPMRKHTSSTVCFLGRLDRRRRPELFFELAKQFPQVRFIVVGRGQDHAWEEKLRATYGGLSNIEMRGFLDQFSLNDLSDVLEKSWILINTFARKELQTSFLEALAHRCAILSNVSPDQVTKRFGFYAQHDEFAEGLHRLLDCDAWKIKGEAGYGYVRAHHIESVIDQHLSVHRAVLSGSLTTESSYAHACAT